MTTNDKPLLLLDIDGVGNIFSGRYKIDGPATNVTRETTTHIVGLDDDIDPWINTVGLRIQIPVGYADLVAQLDEHFDIHWYTMWNEEADPVFARIAGIDKRYPYLRCDWSAGLRRLELDGTPEQTVRRLWTAKTPLLPDYTQGRPFVWIDDDHSIHDQRWLDAQPQIGDFMLIQTLCHEGMTQEHVSTAIAWAQALALDEEMAS